LRFDFTHNRPLDPVLRKDVEDLINEKIREGIEVKVSYMEYDKAIARGALAFFQEKYGDWVRVVEIPGFSMELCGGTHVQKTGEIQIFLFHQESGIQSGVRRAEGIGGRSAIQYLHSLEDRLEKIAQLLKGSPHEIEERITSLLRKKEEGEELLRKWKEKEIHRVLPILLQNLKEVDGIRYLTEYLDGMDLEDLRRIGDILREKVSSAFFFLVGSEGEKGVLFLTLSPPFLGKIHAGNFLKRYLSRFGLKGGGGERSAQGGDIPLPMVSSLLSQFPSFLRETMTLSQN
jgi:alanyl-tRNA synthetase